MKIHIPKKPFNINDISLYTAEKGFEQKGYKICHFEDSNPILDSRYKDIVFGGVSTVLKALKFYGIKIDSVDYPISLVDYLGRLVVQRSIKALEKLDKEGKISYPLFVKPAEHKAFVGRIFNSSYDLFSVLEGYDSNMKVYYSSLVNFESEWRCYVVENEIVKLCHYKGNPTVFPTNSVIQEMLDLLISTNESLYSFSIDVGIVQGETLLVEINDGISLGNYGLTPIVYAHLIETRWKRLLSDDQRPA